MENSHLLRGVGRALGGSTRAALGSLALAVNGTVVTRVGLSVPPAVSVSLSGARHY